jgi:Spy/CpxP family protein refolding chaperone
MKSNLSLTDDQLKKITALQEKTKSDIDKIKKDDKLNDQEKKIEIKKIMESAKENRLKIFTPEQTKKIEEMKKNKKNDHRK